MLEIRLVCENCGNELLANNTEAMICSFECTFCLDCVQKVLHNVCPNCGGGFEKRPIRPKERLMKYPPSAERFIKLVDKENFKLLLLKNKDIKPSER